MVCNGQDVIIKGMLSSMKGQQLDTSLLGTLCPDSQMVAACVRICMHALLTSCYFVVTFLVCVHLYRTV